MRTQRPLCVFFGLGYAARTLLRQMSGDMEYVATSRHIEHREEKEVEGKIVTFYPFSSVPDTIFSHATYVLSSVPPTEAGDDVLRRYGVALSSYCSRCWLGTLSTVGVYGDYGGAWVHEDSPLITTQMRGKRRIEAEKGWRALAGASRHVSIIRLPGIYGIKRCLFDKIIQGRLRHLVKHDHVFSRIHVEDAARGILAIMRGTRKNRTYNLCDDTPSTPSSVVCYGCRLAGVPVPPPECITTAEREGTLHPLTSQFYQECRRVSNQRIKEETDFVLHYPSYKEGLRSLYAKHYKDMMQSMV